MDTTSSLAKLLGLLVAVAVLSPLSSPPAAAAHDHDHIYVRLVEYVGYDRASKHYIIKVERLDDSGSGYDYLHFLSDVSSLRGHEGERMQISIGDDGRWRRLSFGRHGTWRIHSHESGD